MKSNCLNSHEKNLQNSPKTVSHKPLKVAKRSDSKALLSSQSDQCQTPTKKRTKSGSVSPSRQESHSKGSKISVSSSKDKAGKKAHSQERNPSTSGIPTDQSDRSPRRKRTPSPIHNESGNELNLSNSSTDKGHLSFEERDILEFQYYYKRQLSKIQEVSEDESLMQSRLGLKPNGFKSPKLVLGKQFFKQEENQEKPEESQEKTEDKQEKYEPAARLQEEEDTLDLKS